MRMSFVVAVRLPEVPVMVTMVVPVVPILFAVKVSVLVVVVLGGLKEAITPGGRPDAVRLTLPVNPTREFTVMVLAPPAAPWVIVRLFGEVESVKLGDPRTLIRLWPFGLPHPVAMS